MSNDFKRSARISGALAAIMTYLVLLSPLAPLAPAVSRASNSSTAYQSRTVSLRESGNLHLTSRHGFTLNEQGAGTGTISGTIYVHLTIASTKKVTAEMNIYLKGGSITGEASAGYRREGATGSFAGSLSIARGTGSYVNAHGSGLSFSGTIQRSNYAVTVHVNGTVSN